MAATSTAAPEARPRRARATDAYLGLRRKYREPLLGRFTAQLRIILPLAALSVLMVGLIWPLIYDSATGFRLNSARVGGERRVYSTMDNPRFAGVDGSNRPYVVTADRAVQVVKDDKVFDLTRPKGDVIDQGGHWVFAEGDTGRLFEQTKQLDVAGNVVMYHDKGHRMLATRARIDLITGDIASDRGVQGFGPSGTVDADGIQVTRNGRLVHFTGRTRMTIEGNAASGAEAAEPQPQIQPKGGG